MIAILVNGAPWQVHPDTNISDLLSRLKLSPRVCVVEINGKIIEKKLFSSAAIKADDKVEIIRMMGGG
jgi:thiamine biosynthesis protein ThiS